MADEPTRMGQLLELARRNAPPEGAPPEYAAARAPYLLSQEELAQHETTIRKAMIGAPGARSDVEESRAMPSPDDISSVFTMAGAIFPPYDPEVMSMIFEHSSSLRPNIDAYTTNVDGFGHRLVAVVDPESDKATQLVGDALFLERLRESELAGAGHPQASYPTPEEVTARLEEITQLMRLEHAQLTAFFEHAGGDISFTELRRRTCQDLETTGNAYWECLRDGRGQLSEFAQVPAFSMRLAPVEHHHTETEVKRKVGAFRYESAKVRRRFRRFVQVVLDRVVYFKEFGDRRAISRRNGRVLGEADLGDFHDGPATEILHFKVHSCRSPYGIPRWVGALLAVLGNRSAEEVNYLYFDNKAVPPMALLVSGGKLGQGQAEKIKEFISNELRGKENWHKILVIEAESGGGTGNRAQETGRCRIVLQPLMSAQQDDAHFLDYDERNSDKIGGMFRVPRILRGDVRDFNRATADAALEYAEMQVFQGERQGRDDLINRRIFPELGVRFWTYVSNSPLNRNPADLTTIVTALSDAGLITPEEGRVVAADVLNKEFKKIDADWLRQPMPMTLAGVIADPLTGASTEPAPSPGAPAKQASAADKAVSTLASRVLALRESLDKQARQGEPERIRKATAEDGEVVLRVPQDLFDQWVFADDAPAK